MKLIEVEAAAWVLARRMEVYEPTLGYALATIFMLRCAELVWRWTS